MDPVSALATASAAFNVIKKGFEVGRDIEQMAGDLGRWMSAMSDLSEAERQAKNPPLFKKLMFKGSVEEEAMATFAAKKKAEQMREELKQYISWTMGQKAWDELIRMEGQIRKERQETIYAQAQKRQKFVEWLVIGLAICIGIGLLTAFVLILK
jgi:CHASE3 domain sensor protein